MRRAICLIAIAALAPAACTEFPELEAAVGAEARRAPYPALIPLDGLGVPLRDDEGAARLTPATAPEIEARAARLRARAARLRDRDIEGAPRTRHEEAAD